ncbi:LacI family DNA-binding transcriptional regulator [Niabella ginsengisoli]|uniref:LacI family DNA-binding transcriptional regulator n=1 Tax=Niabella ginsengisoli TaxID=522298 RepID=A0ABS9SKL6_9BACT|nr:LacI family DNA-binding transcriptional regulator [Niabella ginsengisoli]MCH5598932.1 LacI family DNA-binding transcriptional regulator [Niabella ginsengisoli]
MGNITIRELAQQLGLSIATVSKGLKDSYEISAATKKKIVSLANELNYTPNPYASSLRKQHSKTIAVVLPEVADSFFLLQSMAFRKWHWLKTITCYSIFRMKVLNLKKSYQPLQQWPGRWRTNFCVKRNQGYSTYFKLEEQEYTRCVF